MKTELELKRLILWKKRFGRIKEMLLTDCFDRKDWLEKDKEYSCI